MKNASSDGHSCTYPKTQRLLKRSEYTSLFRRKKTFTSHDLRHVGLMIDWAMTNLQAPRLGITVTTKQGSSVERNLFKRLVREAFRQSSLVQKIEGVDIHVRIKGSLIQIVDGKARFRFDFETICSFFHNFEQYLITRYTSHGS